MFPDNNLVIKSLYLNIYWEESLQFKSSINTLFNVVSGLFVIVLCRVNTSVNIRLFILVHH